MEQPASPSTISFFRHHFASFAVETGGRYLFPLLSTKLFLGRGNRSKVLLEQTSRKQHVSPISLKELTWGPTDMAITLYGRVMHLYALMEEMKNYIDINKRTE